MNPEQEARQRIDDLLTRAGWAVQDAGAVNLYERRGVAVREVALKTGHGEADYLLYVEGRATGVVEAKRTGSTLTGVEPQSKRYSEGLPDDLPAWRRPLPFLYESTGVETRFTSGLDPDPRSRPVFVFHRPETLAEWLAIPGTVAEARLREELKAAEEREIYVTLPTLRHGLRMMPPLNPRGLWPVQAQAIQNLEASLARDHPRSLVQMATGSGKTVMAAHLVYRLVRHAGAGRVLFLVDRSNLGRQAPWTKPLWIYDLRTNKHFTLKTNPLARADLDDFVAVLADEIAEDLRAALEQFEEIGADLKLSPPPSI